MADPTWGISAEHGWYTPNQLEVIEYTQQDLKDILGGELNLGDNSIAGMLAKVQAGREFKVWQQMSSVYFSQTKNGAEGQFVDEMYAYQGVIRNGAVVGSGKVLIETSSDAEDITPIVLDTTINTTTGLQYVAETTRNVSDYVKAYKITGISLTPAIYNFTITNKDNIVYTQQFTLFSNTDNDRTNFLTAIKGVFEVLFPDDIGSMFLDTTPNNVSLFIGFSYIDNEYILKGISEVFKLTFGINRIGNRYTEISCVGIEKGYNPVPPFSVTSIIPTPTGYQSATNVENFFSGSDIETDASFAVRAEQQSDAPNSSTRPAILADLLAIPDVVGASLDKQVSLTTGIVTVEPILFGGTTEDIAIVLYKTQPINNQYIGDITYTVQTEDGKTEDIKFSRGVDLNMSVRIEYKPQNGVPLSVTEKENIAQAIQDVNSVISVGGTVFNGQLSGSVFDTNPTRFSYMIVKVKLATEPDSSYSTQDYTPLGRELPVLSSDRVEIIQIN